MTIYASLIIDFYQIFTEREQLVAISNDIIE